MKVLKNKKVRNLAIVLLVLGLAGGSYAYANTQNDQDKFGDGQKMAQGAPPNGQPPDGKGGSKGQGHPLMDKEDKALVVRLQMVKVVLVAVVQISTTVVLLKLLPKTPKVVRPMRVPKGIKVLY